MSVKPKQLDMYRLTIPMRSFEHAAASRDTAETILVRLQYSDGFVGWGETLPRDYVTGETYETVPTDIAETIWPACLEGDVLTPDGEPQPIPGKAARRCLNAACCAVDLAGMRRIFHDLHAISPAVMRKIAKRARIRTYIDTHVTGVLGSKDPKKTARRLRLMRWFGMTDFKLKLGLGEEIDQQNLAIVHKQLRRGLKGRTHTLRVDANGAWDEESTPRHAERLKEFGVCAIEQPVYCSASKLVELAENSPLPLIADESLLSERHAKTLLAQPDKIWWNLRLSKNGGLLATLKLMHLASANEVTMVIGCMVGETSILSAAQRRLLQLGPVPRFVEGNYGRLLLSEDIQPGKKSLMFGYAGSLKTLKQDGLGITVDESKVQQLGKHVLTLKA